MTKEDLWARAGDVGRVALIGSALSLPLRRRDPDASFDALVGILACSAVSRAVKAFWDERRPDGEDEKSFRSQHAAECFAAAVAIGRNGRLGGWALAGATGVAVTRVLARKHHPADVIAGAGLGITASSLVVGDKR